MSRISRLVVLVTALTSLFGVMSSSASAATHWINQGAEHFTATAGPGTLTSTGVGIACTSADATGTAPLTSSADVYLVTGTIQFTNCTAAGSAATIECGYTLTGTSKSSPTALVTSGFADVTCGVYVLNSKLCHIEGSVTGHYSNSSATATGILTITTGTTLRVTGASCPTGNNDLGHLTELTFRVVSPDLGPIITRTA